MELTVERTKPCAMKHPDKNAIVRTVMHEYKAAAQSRPWR